MIDSRFDPRKWPGYLMAPLDGPLLTIVVLILGFATVVMVSASPERLDTLALNVGVAFAVMWIAASVPPQRMMTVALTPKGSALLQKMLPGHFKRISEVMSCLNESEKKTLVRLLEKVVGKIGSMGVTASP